MNSVRFRDKIRRGGIVGIVLALSVLLAAWLGGIPDADGAVSGTDAVRGERLTRMHDGPQRYPGVHIDWDVPIRMSDGVVLKANVYRPVDRTGRVVRTPIPTIINMTPYTKLIYMMLTSATEIPGLYDPLVNLFNRFNLFDLSGTPFSGIGSQIRMLTGGSGRTISVDPQLVRSGYAQVVVDVRGTGFSQGVWNGAGAREQKDMVEIARWAGRQPWSTKQIGMTGHSYGGVVALQAAQQPDTPIKAVFAGVPGSDVVRDVIAPGGGIAAGFIPTWVASVNTLKWLPDLKSIATGRFDWKWLSDRVSSPITFFDTLLRAFFTFDLKNIPPDVKKVIDPAGPFRKGIAGHLDRIKIPTFVVGGWQDLFVNSQSEVLSRVDVPLSQKKLVMGNWYHSTTGSGLGSAGAPPRMDVLQRAWFDRWLKGKRNGIDKYSPATLFQQGGAWTSASNFPRPGMTYQRQYLTGQRSGTTTGVVAYDGSLSPRPPRHGTAAVVSPGLSTVCSADAAQGTGGQMGVVDFCAKDARISEVAAATFTSAPVAGPTLISGQIAVHLNTRLDTTDGYWAVTLNDVAPNGQSTVVTTGQLTASLRKIDESLSSRSPSGDYSKPVPYLSLGDRAPVVPGRRTVVDIAFNPTDLVLQKGHRLRIDVFAANFPKGLMIPVLMLESQLRPQTILIDPRHPSYVNLPVSRPMPTAR